MSKMQIKHRWTGEVLYEGEAKTIRDLISTDKGAIEKTYTVGTDRHICLACLNGMNNLYCASRAEDGI